MRDEKQIMKSERGTRNEKEPAPTSLFRVPRSALSLIPHPLLETHEVSKIYQMGSTEVAALDCVTMDVAAGEFVAIQGTSGSGKSTLLNMLGRLDHPTSGEVCYDGLPLGPLTKREMAHYRRTAVGIIFQNFNLIPTMTAEENVSLALAFGGL